MYQKMPSVRSSVYKKAKPTVPKSKYMLVFDNKTIK